MKLRSFNVNSIKAYLAKGLLSQWEDVHPDILGIEELKLTEKEHKDFPFQREGYVPSIPPELLLPCHSSFL